MNFIYFMPTVEYRASVRIAVTLWNQEDIRTSMSSYDCFPLSLDKKWLEIEDVVYEKVKKLLELPISLRDKVSRLIHPIGIQILKWKLYHNGQDYLSISMPNELCWTSQGTIDQKRTAEMLVKDENLEVALRYKLACINCLEEDILALWNKMPECHRMSFYHDVNTTVASHCQQLVMLWTYYLNNELHKLDNAVGRSWRHKLSPNQFAFEVAVEDGNKPATKYFFQKLTPKEREESLMDRADHVAYAHFDCSSTEVLKQNYADILFFLFSQMTEEQQIEFFESYEETALLCLLDWPFQCFFLDTAKNRYKSLVDEDADFDYFLWHMSQKIKEEGKRDDIYKLIFSTFWQHIPPSRKNHIVGRTGYDIDLITELLDAEDKGNVRLLLKEMTAIHREELIFFEEAKDICNDLAFNKKWDIMKFFILECTSSKE